VEKSTPNQTQPKQTCICNKLYYNIKLTSKKQVLVASYDLWHGNWKSLLQK